MVSCVGQPPSAETSHRLLRPLMFETKAMVLPSGGQAVAPMARVVYSFSMVRPFSTCAFGLLVICLGSVMAWGVDKAWARVKVLIVMTLANGMSFRMRSFEMCAPRTALQMKKSVAEAVAIRSTQGSIPGLPLRVGKFSGFRV